MNATPTPREIAEMTRVQQATRAENDASETMGDFWRDANPAMTQASKARRAKNRDDSALWLQCEGIGFTSHNGGVHLVIVRKHATYDFWPGTGLWGRRDTTKRHRGVKRLIDAIRRAEKPANPPSPRAGDSIEGERE